MTELNDSINVILVPQGAEYQAIRRGLQRANSAKPLVIAIPVGVDAVTNFLEKAEYSGNILIMGLCGSLSHQYQVGDIVMYQNCLYQPKNSDLLSLECDKSLTTLLGNKLQNKAHLVNSLTSDSLIWNSAEKKQLGSKYQADVVDMEGYAALQLLTQAGARVAMIRVVSDSCNDTLPDLTTTINSQGKIEPLPLAFKMLQNPLAAISLIRGALRGLQVLKKVTKYLS